MKKLLSAILIFAFLLSSLVALTACDTPADDTQGEGGSQDNGNENAFDEAYKARCDWGKTLITVQLSENSSWGIHPDVGRRYLAGENTSYNDTIDVMVRERNQRASEIANVEVGYKYYLNDGSYGSWYRSYFSNLADDIYVNHIAEVILMSLSIKSKNLLSEDYYDSNGEPFFAFAKDDYDPKKDDEGYLYDYMKACTINPEHMYVLSSDFLIDIFRSFAAIPVNFAVLETLNAENSESCDSNNDGKITRDELYGAVFANEWNFELLKKLSAMAAKSDKVGFALSRTTSPEIEALMSGQGFSIVSASDGYFQEPNRCPSSLESFMNALIEIINSTGINFYSGGSVDGKLVLAHNKIKEAFLGDEVLFGGIATLSFIEGSYKDLNEAGNLGILPIPRYEKYNKETHGDSYYNAAHTCMANGAMIDPRTTSARQCAAWLNYQTVSSGEVFDKYCETLIPGSEETVKILKNMRDTASVGASDCIWDNAMVALERRASWDDVVNKFVYSPNLYFWEQYSECLFTRAKVFKDLQKSFYNLIDAEKAKNEAN